jgi:hypothetical protein
MEQLKHVLKLVNNFCRNKELTHSEIAALMHELIPELQKLESEHAGMARNAERLFPSR